MTFYGESYSLEWANPIAGTPFSDFGDSIRYHFDGESSIVNAGDSFIAGVYPSPIELTSSDTAVVSWVIETGPASAGVLRIKSGLDPNWSLNDPGQATEALDDQPVTGSQTLVAVTTAITVSDILVLNEQPILYVECLSGDVEIVQIKLRAWPPDGPSGAWTQAPSSVIQAATQVKTYRALGAARGWGYADEGPAENPNYFENAPALAAAWEIARSDLMTHQGELLSFASNTQATIAGGDITGSTGAFEVFGGPHDGEFVYDGWAELKDAPGFLIAQPESASVPWPAGAGYDPREVWDEDQSWARRAGGGDVVGSFAGWTGTLRAEYSASRTMEGGEGGRTWVNWAVGPAAVHMISLGSTYDPAVPSGMGTNGQDTYEFLVGGSQEAISPGDQSNTLVEHEFPIAGSQAIAILARPPGLTDSSAVPVLGPILNSTGEWNHFIVDGHVLVKIVSPSYLVAFGEYEYFNPSLPWVDDVEEPHYVPGRFELAKPNLAGDAGDVRVNFAGL